MANLGEVKGIYSSKMLLQPYNIGIFLIENLEKSLNLIMN